MDLDIVLAHHERVTLRVGTTFVKVDVDDRRIQREVASLDVVEGVPRPEVAWHHEHVVALSQVAGAPLAELGRPSTSSPAAWRGAGEVARRIHAHEPPVRYRETDLDVAADLDELCRWLVDREVAPITTVDAVRRQAEAVLRPVDLVFTHGDLQAAHVFVDGDVVTGVIDWSDAGAGDPLFDLAVLTVGHPERLDDVLEGYGSPDADRSVIRGWWAVRRLASVRWMIEHGFDASGDVAALHWTVDHP